MNTTPILAAAVAAFLISCSAVFPLRRLALRWDLTDRPGANKAHARPTPYLGGVAIAVGALAPAAALAAVDGVMDYRVTAIMLGAAAVALVGLIDDIRPLRPVTRLIVESAAATGVVLSGVHVTLFGGWVDVMVTVMWIVVMTNSFNLLDNMDGALGAVTTCTAGCLAAVAFARGHMPLGLLLTALACAGLGFLPHNWAPARIFMGDSGSLFIGFGLTCSAVMLVMGQGAGVVISGLLLPTFVATVDTGVVFLSRLRAGRSPLSGGTDHVSHRLCRRGVRPRGAATVLGLAAAFSGALCLAMTLGMLPSLVTALLASGSAVALVGMLQGVSIYLPVEHFRHSPRIRERRR
ncbi:MraY family glycosyltransferase [Nonomuraea sp. NPDC005501]|uniref:glycosyltransferase family 4 protein n=1 Tax=Nonomuraea sp. NPDC005501 TaxID=3156884 RepID=UPI0033B7175D